MSSFRLQFPFVKRQLPVVWAITILVTAILMLAWYVVQPSSIFVINVFEDVHESGAVKIVETKNVMDILRLGVNIGIPIMIVAVWVWAILCSIRKWTHGEYVYE